MTNEEYKIIRTGIRLTEDEINEIQFCQFDPTALMYGPKETKEPYEILQEIAERRGLPKLDDMYGMTSENEIVCRDIEENRRQLKSFLENKLSEGKK
ncbi:MAG: hypothetical protein ABIB79_02775 [archaeon]